MFDYYSRCVFHISQVEAGSTTCLATRKWLSPGTAKSSRKYRNKDKRNILRTKSGWDGSSQSGQNGVPRWVQKKIESVPWKKKSKGSNASASKSKNEAMQTNIHYPKTWTSRQKKANIDLLTLNLVKLLHSADIGNLIESKVIDW